MELTQPGMREVAGPRGDVRSRAMTRARDFLQRWELEISPQKTLFHAAVWTAAGLVGLIAVLYARLIAWIQGLFFTALKEHAIIVSCAGPLFFVLATFLVKRFAPDAKGSGIPQVLAVIDKAKTNERRDAFWTDSLVSMRTAIFKILSSCAGILGGASIGREGPTVQISASVFALVGRVTRRFSPQVTFQAFVIAGGASGVAAAFNTPLAGIAFALEEVARGAFGQVQQTVMLAVIIGGIISQALSGNYLYFGHLPDTANTVLLLLGESMVIGIAGGLLGGVFAKFLSKPSLARLPTHWFQRALATGIICAALGYFTHGDTSGSGYEVTRKTLENASLDHVSVMYPLYKLTTTTLSYLSGMGGGIFSPCLAIGSGLGLAIAKLAHFPNFEICALMGMVAFFSGAIRAPLTSVIIVMEMTDEHILILPFMIAAYIAHSTGRRIMPVPLYHVLARAHVEEEHTDEPPAEQGSVLTRWRVQDVMTSEVVTVPASATFDEILRLLQQTRHGAFPVLDRQQRLSGLLLVDQIRPFIGSDDDISSVVAADFAMPSPPVTVPAETLEDARRKMLSNGLSHLPVVDDARRDVLLGIVSYKDILMALESARAKPADAAHQSSA